VTEFSGHVNTIYRESDRIARPMDEWSPAVHAVLRHLEARGFRHSPRFLGTGVYRDRPVEWLSWIDGVEIPAADYSIEALRQLGEMIRELHDATQDFVLPDDTAWAHPAALGVTGDFVICHNDLAPRNTVCVDGLPVALIDWDLTQPAPRIWDIVHAIWQYVPLRDGIVPDTNRIRALLEGYAMPSVVPDRLAEMIAQRMQQTITGIAALADAGEPAFVRLRDDGVVEAITRDRAWVLSASDAIDASVD
jgi:Ser/Thr protein kinase RdoA (MazF antagonist)